MNVAPAFRPWVWACFWLLIIWGVLWLFVRETASHPVRAFFQQIDADPVKSNAFTVVAFGDSLLATSLGESHTFNEMLGDRANWLHIAKPGAKLSDFKRGIKYAIGKQVDLILLQDSLLLHRPNGTKDAARFLVEANQLIAYLAEWALRILSNREPLELFGLNSAQINYAAKHHSNLIYDSILESEKVKRKRHDRRQWYQASVPLESETFDILKRIVSHDGVQAKFFHLPIAKEFDTRFPDDKWLAYLNLEMKHLGLESFVLEKPLKQTFYSDGRHINQWGRAVRQEQFISFVEQVCCD